MHRLSFHITALMCVLALCGLSASPASATGDVCATEAHNDPIYSQGFGDAHALWLPGIGTDFVFAPTPGAFFENVDGTATLSGTAWSSSNPSQGFTVDVVLAGRTTTTPPGSPKKELDASAYAENGGPIDTSTWTYYTALEGVLNGLGDFAGAVIEIELTGAAFQLGDGANGKNILFGASSWIAWNVTTQPTAGPSLQTTGEGDFNLDLSGCDSQCVDRAVSDPALHNGNHSHALWLPGIGKDFVFDPELGTFIELDNGTAYLTGVARRVSNPAEAFEVQVVLTDFSATPPPGSPKKELKSSAYANNGGPIDPATWRYYSNFTGVLIGLDDFAGALIEIEQTGAAFQIGEGANGKNGNFGAASWLHWNVLDQPNSGGTLKQSGQGDFNLDLVDCEPGECDSRILYGIHDEGESDTQFFRLNIDSGDVTPIGPLYAEHDIETIDIHPDTGEIYAIAGNSGDQDGNFYLLDKETGALTLLGNTGSGGSKVREIAAATFSSDGTLWAWWKRKGIYIVNLSDGSLTFEWKPPGTGDDPGRSWDGMAWAPDSSALWGSQDDNLYRWDPDTRTMEVVCGEGFLPFRTETLDFDLQGNLVGGWHNAGTAELSIFRIDVDACTIDESSYLTNFRDIEGLAFEVGCDDGEEPPPPPEPASLAGTVWEDDNEDGTIDGDEGRLADVTVELYAGGDLVGSTTTDGDGNYSFSDLTADDYEVVVVDTTLPDGVTPTSDIDGTDTPHTAGVTLVEGEDRGEVDFGYVAPAPSDPWCPRTPGFWKNHTDVWPVDSLVIGGVEYDAATLLSFLQYGGPDASLKLARHLTATLLNLAMGSDSSILPSVQAADDFLASYPPGSSPSGSAKQEALAIKDELDAYNNIECEDDDNGGGTCGTRTMFGIHDENESDTQFFRLDLISGDITPLGPLYAEHDIETIDIHPVTGEIYAIAGNSGDQDGNYYLLDKDTGALTLLGNLGTGGSKVIEIAASSFAADGTLWAWWKRKGLHTIDLSTGTVTQEWRPPGSGDHPGRSWDGMAWSPDGSVLWGSQDDQLYRWDPATRTMEEVCGPGFLPFRTEALDFNLEGELLGGWHDADSAELSIFKIDVDTCTVTPSDFPTDFRDIEGMAFETTCTDP